MPLESMQDLLMEQLRDLQESELQLAMILPRMIRLAQNEALRRALESYHRETEEHIARIVTIFEYFGTATVEAENPAVTALLAEIGEALVHEASDELFDAALIIELRQLAHFHIAGYTALIGVAEALGEVIGHRLLQMTLDEVLATEERLSLIARTEVNPDGVMAGIPGEALQQGIGLQWTDFSL